MTFSEKVVLLRNQANMTQEQLSDKLEVPRELISRWESGTAMPDADGLQKICDIFQVPLDWLLTNINRSERRGKPVDEKPPLITPLLVSSIVILLAGILCLVLNLLVTANEEILPRVVMYLCFILAPILFILDQVFRRQK